MQDVHELHQNIKESFPTIIAGAVVRTRAVIGDEVPRDLAGHQKIVAIMLGLGLVLQSKSCRHAHLADVVGILVCLSSGAFVCCW